MTTIDTTHKKATIYDNYCNNLSNCPVSKCLTRPALVAGGDALRALRPVAPQLERVADVGAVVVRAHVARDPAGWNIREGIAH